MPAMPRRESELARPRKRRGGDVRPVSKGIARPAVIPDHDPDWHPIAIQLYIACQESGQQDWYQSSDWALLWSLCDDLSVYKQGTRRSPEMLKGLLSGFTSLLVTEGDRRKVRIELEAPAPENDEPAGVTAINQYQQRLAQPPTRK